MTKVAIDLRWVRSEQIDGIGRYTLGLTKALEKEDLELVFLYHQEKLLILLKKELGGGEFARIPFDILTLADLIQLPGFLVKLKIDVYLTPHYFTSLWHRGYKVISIIHDLIPFLYPQYLSSASVKLKVFYAWPIFAKWMVDRANLLITNSQATKKDAVKMFGLAEKKIEVLYPGIDFTPISPGGGRYILYLGRMEPYKNLETLINAFARLPADLRDKYPLRLAGAKKEPYYSQLLKLVKNLNLGDQVRFSGFIDDSKLAETYAGAAVFVYPSLYEGLGIPVLEARFAKVPVVTSNVSSLPEAGDGGALLIDPKNEDELAEAIEKVLTDSAVRARLIDADDDMIQFSWKNAAGKLKQKIDEIVA